MTKQDFLEGLRMSLSGKVNAAVLTDNIRYYEDYINTEVRKGKSEEEVMGTLGDPRLIARTIVETSSSQAAGVYGESPGDEVRDYSGYGQHEGKKIFNFYRVPMWVWLILGIIIVALVLSAVFSVLSVVLPVLLPILAILFVVKLFRDWF